MAAVPHPYPPWCFFFLHFWSKAKAQQVDETPPPENVHPRRVGFLFFFLSSPSIYVYAASLSSKASIPLPPGQFFRDFRSLVIHEGPTPFKASRPLSLSIRCTRCCMFFSAQTLSNPQRITCWTALTSPGHFSRPPRRFLANRSL